MEEPVVTEGKKDAKDKGKEKEKEKEEEVEPTPNEPVQRAFGVIGIAQMQADAMEMAKDADTTTPQPAA